MNFIREKDNVRINMTINRQKYVKKNITINVS